MIKYAAPVLFIFILAVIGFGLAYTFWLNMKVAPEISQAAEGRQHAHTKNTTWLGGTQEDVTRAIATAVMPGNETSLENLPADWRARITALTSTPSTDSPYIVILPGAGQDALTWALPGAYWAVYARAPVMFAGGSGLSHSDMELLERLRKPVYVLAPEMLVKENTIRQIAVHGPVERITAKSPEDYAVRLAKYRNEKGGFGWGRTYGERYGYFHYVLASVADTQSALAALPLAYTNAATLLYAARTGGFSPALDAYLWQQRSDWFTTPSEGPFRHLWIAGNALSYAAQARADLAIEKADYPARGPAALGPLEALSMVFIALGLCGALFVWLHSRRFVPDAMTGMRLAWTGTALLLPVLGALLYLAANAPMDKPRTNLQKAAAATAMGFGYGAPLMIAVGYAFVWFGMPNFYGHWASGVSYLFGSGMVLMMAGMYVFAVLVAGPLAQFPMRAMMNEDMPKRAVFGQAMKVTALSMAAVSLGMMSMTWWMMKYHLPMMPKEDEILWFGSIWLGSSLGFLIAWPLNWPMIAAGLKKGGM